MNTQNPYSSIDISQTKIELRKAIHDFSERGLLNSAKWIAEQLIGIRKCEEKRDTVFVEHHTILQNEREIADTFAFAKTLFDLKEYYRCAFYLQKIDSSKPSKLVLKALFLKFYATYLAGEKRREEEVAENSGSAGQLGAIVENKELKQLYVELKALLKLKQMDPFLYYIYGVVLHGMNQKQDAIVAFVEAVNGYPLLWAAWQELVALSTNKEVFADVRCKLKDHWMKDLFIANVQLELQQSQDALNIFEKLQYLFPNSSYLQAQIAMANYNLTEFIVAQQQFEKLRKDDPYRLENMDTYSNILYVKEAKASLSFLAHEAHLTDKFRPETCCIIGNYYSRKGNHEKAVIYFKRALKLDKNYLSAWTLMGHEYVEMKNTTAAVHAYRTAVDINPRDYRAWYGLGQTYEILQMQLYALYYYSKATALRQYDGRMWCALAGCYESLGRYRDALRCYERARQNQDPDGIALQKMATLHRMLGNDSKAADCYIKLLSEKQELDDDNELDANDAKALLYLTAFFKEQNKLQEAEKYCLRLLDFSGPEKEQGKALLREIRSMSGEPHRFTFSPSSPLGEHKFSP